MSNKDHALKYGTTVYAALIFLFFVVAYTIYSYITSRPVDLDDYIIDVNEEGLMEVSPGEDAGPDYLPDDEPPPSPPPGN